MKKAQRMLISAICLLVLFAVCGCCPICYAPIQMTDHGLECYHRPVPWPEWMDAEHWEKQPLPGHCKCGAFLSGYKRINAVEGQCPKCKRYGTMWYRPEWSLKNEFTVSNK